MQPLPVAEKAWFTPRSGTFHRLRAGVVHAPCTQLLEPDSTRPSHFARGSRNLFWCGLERVEGGIPPGEFTCLPTQALNTVLPGLNRLKLFPLTLEGKIKPGQITFFRSGHSQGEVYSAEWRAGNETGMDSLFAWQILSICYGSGMWFLLPRYSVQCTQTVHSLA